MQPNAPVRYAAERLVLRLLGALLVALFLVLGVPQLWRLFSPFLVALPIAALLQPLIHFFQEKLHLRRGIAVAFWVLLVCCVAFILLYWFVSFVVVQVMNAANNAPSIISSVVNVLQAATDRILDAAQSTPLAIEQTIRASLDSAFRSISDAGMSLASELINLTLSFAASLPYALIYANFLILGLLFLSGRYETFHRFFQKRKNDAAAVQGNDSETASNPAAGAPVLEATGFGGGESIAVLRQSAIKGMMGYIRVQLLFFLITFLLSWVYFQFLGFEYALVIGLVAALLELIPQFGCGTLYLPWSALSFIVGSSQNGWLILGLYLGYCALRRFTEPMLLGSHLGVSPLLSLVGMFVGMQLAGIPGLIAGPIAMVILSSTVRAHLFDHAASDCKIVFRYLQRRWKRGSRSPENAKAKP